MISERTRDKMSAARRKGKWVGGNPVLGYDVHPDGGSLVVNAEEAARVRTIFGLYLEHGSLLPVVSELDHRGWTLKCWTTRDGKTVGGKPFTRPRLHQILTNVIYTGQVRHRGEIYPGEHEAIVDRETWDKVHAQLKANAPGSTRNLRNKHGALLKGAVRCATCNVGTRTGTSFPSTQSTASRRLAMIRLPALGFRCLVVRVFFISPSSSGSPQPGGAIGFRLE